MRPTQQFLNELYAKFDGRFRLRWSTYSHEWQLEQKVMNPKVIPPPITIDEDTGGEIYDTFDDAWVRASDGYMLVMSMRDGDRMPCPICYLTVKVPIMETRESTCEHCRFQGRDGRYRAAFYPFNHVLIEHLQFLDPDNGGVERVKRKIRDRQVARIAKSKERSVTEGEERLVDAGTQALGNQMIGYGNQKSADATRLESKEGI